MKLFSLEEMGTRQVVRKEIQCAFHFVWKIMFSSTLLNIVLFFFLPFFYINLISFLFLFQFYLFILLHNIVLVLPYIDMNPPQGYTCSPSWTPLPPPSPSHPSGSAQCTSPENPVSCIEPGLVIHFTCDNLHVSMPLSHIVSPSPSPTEYKRLFYTSVSLLLSCI